MLWLLLFILYPILILLVGATGFFFGFQYREKMPTKIAKRKEDGRIDKTEKQRDS